MLLQPPDRLQSHTLSNDQPKKKQKKNTKKHHTSKTLYTEARSPHGTERKYHATSIQSNWQRRRGESSQSSSPIRIQSDKSLLKVVASIPHEAMAGAGGRGGGGGKEGVKEGGEDVGGGGGWVDLKPVQTLPFLWD